MATTQTQALKATIAALDAEIKALKALGSTARGPVVRAAAPKRFKVPCAYGIKACGTFLPHGVGSRQHTTCPKGKAALKAARS